MNLTNDLEPMVRPIEASKILSIRYESLMKLIHSGQIPAVRIGRVYRIPRKAIEKIVAEGVGSSHEPHPSTPVVSQGAG
jgi:excisionase family DNA binding protein